ncbi:thioredoxin family protein [Phyllobacterium sp. 22229]|jgi:peroxiredoxin|uniref:Thioredoxin family protein n=1 Tax=Phyllobacterium myrsinacearum TaxID=28101 RepID=A0A2S9JH49_9HYPH|nr:thioredoxin family protein [Phyllobacterium myrsinacearum]PRD52318.1 thioredoxin family protein [Phyllobacterium myrsinacearum]PWV92324.1 AhpC/TSA family protein [Phyllobacterium myrsinacearum]RZS77780.1 AhpC/TSA family protein [Phyllobacterium myrsinacearum]RZV04867.1 AhpC/TSA family protein [Phyllobacterium myrsinacearum]
MAAVPPLCDFGWRAVDASLIGTGGQRHSLLAQAGRHGLVVAFICNHCPYVKAVIGRIVRDAHDLAALDVGFVAINANDAAAYPADSYENMQRFSRENAFPFPYLHDADQAVARAYGAVCTPDFFGFNARGELQYRGRLDGSRKQEAIADLRRDLFEAMRQIAQSGTGPREQIASVGCSIKWRDSP